MYAIETNLFIILLSGYFSFRYLVRGAIFSGVAFGVIALFLGYWLIAYANGETLASLNGYLLRYQWPPGEKEFLEILYPNLCFVVALVVGKFVGHQLIISSPLLSAPLRLRERSLNSPWVPARLGFGWPCAFTQYLCC